VLGQLRRRGRLAGALQARHEDDRRRLGVQVDVADALAHGGGQFAADDAHQGLARGQGAQHLMTHGLVLDAGDKVPHHRQGDVRFEQRHAHLAQHVLHVGLGDAGLAPELLARRESLSVRVDAI